MKKLKKRIIVLIVSFLILMLLLGYYEVTIKEENSYEGIAVQSSENVIQEISEVDEETEILEDNEEEKKELEVVENELNNIEPVAEQPVQVNDEEIYVEIIHAEVVLEDVGYKEGINYGITQSIGNVEPKYINAVEEMLLNLPPALVNSFIENDWSLYVTTDDLAAFFDYKVSSVLGLTNYNEKVIYIEDRVEAVYGAVEHEFGHYLDYITNVQSLGYAFNEIYNEEVDEFKSNIPNPGCVSGPQEFFAETFAWLLIDESKCTPKAKEFVESALNQLISWKTKKIPFI